MAEKFILDFTAREIETEDSEERAGAWLRMAAHYVVSLEDSPTLADLSYKGFRDGWRILYRANLTTRSMDEYLREAVPSGSLYEALPEAE